MSTLKVSTLQNASSATANITLDASGNATVGNNLTVTGGLIPSSSFLRNKIINGDMRIDQRNAGASVTPTNGQYLVDRWAGLQSVASKYSAQQNAGSVTPPAGFTNYLGATSLSAYSVGASEYFGLRQSIEGFNVADLAWGTANAQTVTLSFWVRSSLTGTFGGALQNNASNRFYAFSYVINAANVWEYKTVSIAGDTTGTWATDNNAGIRVTFGLGVGSSLSVAAGSWGSSGALSVTGATSVVGTNGATFYLTGVQLEVGSVATPFERRQYGQELALCQRYYEQKNITNQTVVVTGQAVSTTAAIYVIPCVTTKRATPAGSVSGTFIALNNFAGGAGGSLAFNSGDVDQVRFDITGASGLTAGNASLLYANSAGCAIRISSEL